MSNLRLLPRLAGLESSEPAALDGRAFDSVRSSLTDRNVHTLRDRIGITDRVEVAGHIDLELVVIGKSDLYYTGVVGCIVTERTISLRSVTEVFNNHLPGLRGSIAADCHLGRNCSSLIPCKSVVICVRSGCRAHRRILV